MLKTYIALKPLYVEGQKRAIGDLIPEAASWAGNILQGAISCREIERVRVVTPAEYKKLEGKLKPLK